MCYFTNQKYSIDVVVYVSIQGNTNETITFDSNSGPLLARRNHNGIKLDFPLNPVTPYPREDAMPLVKVNK